jgi:hypothetical protein
MIKLKNIYTIISLSLFVPFTANASSYLEGISDDIPYIVGKALYFPLDSDLAQVGIYDLGFYNELSQHAQDRHINNENQTVLVQMGSVNPLTTREAGMLDALNKKAFDLVEQYYKQEITYLCYGRKVDPEYGELLQCSFLADSADIASDLLRQGMAKYNPEEFNQWQHDEYIYNESLAKEQLVGVWESKPLAIFKGIKAIVSE